MAAEEDRIRLLHMLEAAREAVAFVEGRSADELQSDRMLNYAVLHAIGVIGEAASQVGEQTHAAYADLPWSEMIGMRNRLIHAYHDVNLQIVWRTVTQDLPPLILALEDILGGESDGAD